MQRVSSGESAVARPTMLPRGLASQTSDRIVTPILNRSGRSRESCIRTLTKGKPARVPVKVRTTRGCEWVAGVGLGKLVSKELLRFVASMLVVVRRERRLSPAKYAIEIAPPGSRQR